MIEHIVLFRWKSEAADEQVADAMEGLRGLKEAIPGIVSLSCGVDFTGRAHGYTLALVIRFADRPSFDAYGPHPAHRSVVETLLVPILADVIDFDFEVAA